MTVHLSFATVKGKLRVSKLNIQAKKEVMKLSLPYLAPCKVHLSPFISRMVGVKFSPSDAKVAPIPTTVVLLKASHGSTTCPLNTPLVAGPAVICMLHIKV